MAKTTDKDRVYTRNGDVKPFASEEKRKEVFPNKPMSLKELKALKEAKELELKNKNLGKHG